MDDAADSDRDSDAATLVDQEGVAEDVLSVRRGSTASTAASRTAARNSGGTDIVKVAVTVNGKTQLLEVDQGLALDAVCRGLCEDHGVRWRPGRYALALLARPTRAHPHAAQKYLTEDNRHDLLRNGVELGLTYAPDVFAEIIGKRLADRKDREEWSWAVQKLAELSGDAMFLAVFAALPGAVDSALEAFPAEDKRDHKLRVTETLWVLRVALCLVRHGVLGGGERGLPNLVRQLCALVRAEHGVEAAVLEASLRVLAVISAQPWAVSAAQHVSVGDLVPMLWDTERPAVQTAALELMNALAAREARLGRASPEGRMQVTKTITSPQVCATIVRNVLGGPVRSTMARQLSLLQRLLLQPLKKAITVPAHGGHDQGDHPTGPPPRLPRRKSRVGMAWQQRVAGYTGKAFNCAVPQAAALLHSRSWCEGEAREPLGEPREAGDRRSLDDDAGYKELGTLGVPRPVDAAATTTDSSPSGAADLYGSRASLTSVASVASVASTASDNSRLWPDDAEDGLPTLSALGAQCLEYLSSQHPALHARAQEEEEALCGSLPLTAERLVRLLGAELALCDDPGPAPAAPAAYQPLAFVGDVPFFHELFCRGLNLLAKTRREMRAKTPRDQDKVLRVVRRQFREALGAQVSSWDQLDSWLSELPYSAVAALWEKERVSVEQDTVLSSAAVRDLRAARAPALQQLVRQQRMATLRAGAAFRRPSKMAQKGKRPSVWVWLAQGDTTLQYADCAGGCDDGDPPPFLGTPQAVPVTSITSISTGRKCASLWGASRGRKQGADLALSLLLDPNDCATSSLDLVAPDVATLEAWADGLHLLLGKEFASKATLRDLDCLMDMEVRLHLMELDGISLPSEPPPVPPAPPDFDFVTA